MARFIQPVNRRAEQLRPQIDAALSNYLDALLAPLYADFHGEREKNRKRILELELQVHQLQGHLHALQSTGVKI